ncbi:hypothetical protein GGR57DRAFT_509188 [Xylariaceae sp. FL1272]|nr:hypothetical protein GGR57DRAFT_509188 [Xylariaceae sp. FL1272]
MAATELATTTMTTTISTTTATFHLDFNEIFKQAIINALGLVPEVGGFIAAMTDALWPSNKPAAEQPMEQLMAYVNSMMFKLLDQLAIEKPRDDINGMHDNLKGYVNATSDQERQDKMKYLLNISDTYRSQFYDDNRPWATLTYLVAFGTIRLSLLREKYLHYEKIYGVPDGNPALTLQNLNDEIAAFTQKVNDSRDYAHQWRLDCIHITDPPTEERNGPLSWIFTWTVTDKAEDYSKLYQKITHPVGDPIPNDEGAAKADYSNRINFANTTYVSGLEELLAPSVNWPYFDPTSPYTPTPLPSYWFWPIGDGVNPGGNKDWDDRNFYLEHGPTTAVTIYHGDWVDGIEVWYGGVSSGLRGQKGGSPSSITLGPDEIITTMGGITASYVPKFWISTNLRSGQVGGGKNERTTS